MCLSNPVRVTVRVASSAILPQNGNRIGILLPPSTVAAYSVDWDKPAVVGEGFTIPVGGHPLQLLANEWGCTLQRGIHAISAGVEFSMTVIELLKGESPEETPYEFGGQEWGQTDDVGEHGWSPTAVPVV
jgi:hypothetical protein